mmetsp:Transcript_17841/g.29323  ORF Transcript_17841/g.29323 Transcript_17841/m.29323 type:complete len:200 (-) Transcript_17841:438-1037(-)|eukprot:CAMPEP_0184334014 /NCGR_PEP_ID=MMETSP1089-20130417/2934_1 /TAXON_ID=38269 ORGANISM="Gloeochaete wittrockiana, Strain SAG46.84" /NCGR_SAMPLE_ID=MMETSP1089 /ASSEMBLY_ACC=CAM_ASM_000445 /LENGTH=199 /DNA_ID=CAMNT_0026658137 /DNA_START=143 /DNA_END=742 /DNA_ORIENTATION=+
MNSSPKAKELRSPSKTVTYLPNLNQSGPPLDYTFLDIKTVSEILDEEPLSGTVKVDGSSGSESNAIRLSSNQLSSLEGPIFHSTLSKILNPSALVWLDLSFNKLTSVDEVLLSLPSLSVLYLHSNCISKLSETKKLGRIKKLFSLTLQDNPIGRKGHWKQYILAHVPQLRNLDFSAVTKHDRVKSLVWHESQQRAPSPA